MQSLVGDAGGGTCIRDTSSCLVLWRRLYGRILLCHVRRPTAPKLLTGVSVNCFSHVLVLRLSDIRLRNSLSGSIPTMSYCHSRECIISCWVSPERLLTSARMIPRHLPRLRNLLYSKWLLLEHLVSHSLYVTKLRSRAKILSVDWRCLGLCVRSPPLLSMVYFLMLVAKSILFGTTRINRLQRWFSAPLRSVFLETQNKHTVYMKVNQMSFRDYFSTHMIWGDKTIL